MNEIRLRATEYPLVRNIGFTLTQQGWTHPDRLLDYHVFIYVIHGQMQVVEEGTEYLLQEGDALFLKRGIHHWGGAGTLPGTSTFWIHFCGSKPGSEVGREAGNGDLENWHMSPSYNVFLPEHYDFTLKLPKRAQVRNIPYMYRKIKELYDAYASSRTYNHLHISMGAMDIFLDLLRASRDTPAGNKADLLIRRLIGHLEEHCAEELETDRIASRFQLNYRYISTLFKARVGTSIFKYHERLRIHHAAELLKNTVLNISEVSDRVGFQSPFYFSKVFKKVMGEAPSEYIRNIYRN
ncbi:MAG: AraC family transcriptional regulator [Paenibacillus sp.]|nr:AraC family transcriptional regulator [Paenibacillus sp.]